MSLIVSFCANSQVAEKVAALAVDSPLSEYAGTITTEERDDVTMTNLNSYLDIHRNLNIRRKSKCVTEHPCLQLQHKNPVFFNLHLLVFSVHR